MSLLKHVYAERDLHGQPLILRYLRTKDQKEIDFVLVNQNKEDEVEQGIEVKTSEATLSSTLARFADHYHFPGVQVVRHLKHEQVQQGIEIISGLRFLKNLTL